MIYLEIAQNAHKNLEILEFEYQKFLYIYGHLHYTLHTIHSLK